MNTYTIESFFENYKELIPSVIEKGRILRLGYNEENGTFTCQAAFDKLVPFDSTETPHCHRPQKDLHLRHA